MRTSLGDNFPNLNQIISRTANYSKCSLQILINLNDMANERQNQYEKEIRSYFEERRKNLSILATTTSPTGQIIDWIPVESQGIVATPPPSPAIQSDRGASVAVAELDMEGAEKGPKGTVPVLRKNLDAIEFKEPLSKYLNKVRGAQPGKDAPSTLGEDAPVPQAGGTHRYGSSQQGMSL